MLFEEETKKIQDSITKKNFNHLNESILNIINIISET